MGWVGGAKWSGVGGPRGPSKFGLRSETVVIPLTNSKIETGIEIEMARCDRRWAVLIAVTTCYTYCSRWCLGL